MKCLVNNALPQFVPEVRYRPLSPFGIRRSSSLLLLSSLELSDTQVYEP